MPERPESSDNSVAGQSTRIIGRPGTGKTLHLISEILPSRPGAKRRGAWPLRRDQAADHSGKASIPGPSMIINDPKDQIFRATGSWRGSHGPVYSLRWNDPGAAAWNPLSAGNVTGGAEVLVVGAARQRPADSALLGGADELWEGYVDGLAAAAVPVPEQPGKEHWVLAGRAALSGFLLFEMAQAARDGREPSFGHMLDWLAPSGAAPDLTEALLDLAAAEVRTFGYPERAAAELVQLRNKPRQERAAVISAAIGKLNIFRDAAIRSRTSRSDFTFADLRPRGAPAITVYIHVPLEDCRAHGVLTAMFLHGAARYLMKEAQLPDRPVHFLLDEFWTLPPVELLTQIPEHGASRLLRLVAVGQSEEQLARRLVLPPGLPTLGEAELAHHLPARTN